MKKHLQNLIKVIAVLVIVILTSQSHPAQAIETYSDTEQQQFMDWCTGAKSATQSTCSCTLKRIAQTVPAAALTQYLTSQGSFTLSSAAVTTGATVTQALLSCSNG